MYILIYVQVDIQHVANPRVEAEDHYYNINPHFTFAEVLFLCFFCC